jgi:hypothetical protein
MRKLLLVMVCMFFGSMLFSQVVNEQAEKISSFKISDDQIIFTAWTSGYTTKASFRLDIAKTNTGYNVTLMRIKRDVGKMMPQPFAVSYSQFELRTKSISENQC